MNARPDTGWLKRAAHVRVPVHEACKSAKTTCDACVNANSLAVSSLDNLHAPESGKLIQGTFHILPGSSLINEGSEVIRIYDALIDFYHFAYSGARLDEIGTYQELAVLENYRFEYRALSALSSTTRRGSSEVFQFVVEPENLSLRRCREVYDHLVAQEVDWIAIEVSLEARNTRIHHSQSTDVIPDISTLGLVEDRSSDAFPLEFFQSEESTQFRVPNGDNIEMPKCKSPNIVAHGEREGTIRSFQS